MRKPVWRLLIWILPATFMSLLLTVLSFNYFTHNIHEVIAGKLYRSSQLDVDDLEHLIAHYHIRSVVNLRGPYPRAKWYQDELAVSDQYHVQHYDAHLHDHGVPTRQQLKKIVNLLQTAPKPLLVHCRQGADRTGLMSAMGVIVMSDASMRQARRQASWLYNVLSPHSVGYEMLRNYDNWLQQSQLAHSKKAFLQWVNADSKLISYSGVFLY